MNESKKSSIKDKLMEIARTEIRLSYSAPEAPLPPCSSRIGGCPAVPSDFVWPEYTGEGYDGEIRSRPLAFLAQINLKEIAGFDPDERLPKTGILSFFYEYMSMPWGFDPKDRGCARVFYFPEEAMLTPHAIPEHMEEECILPERSVTFAPHISLPEFSDSPAFCHGLDWDDYDECCRECGYERDDWGDRTKLFGYPDVIQDSMEEECESVTRGFRRGCPEDYANIPDAEKEDIRSKAAEWMPLFQMGTIETEDGEMMFGDCGHIYFWIRKSDLQALDFDKTWLILQCC